MTSPTPSTSDVMIIAAEASSCLYAQRLLEHYKNNKKPLKAFGIGNQAMSGLGFDCIGRAEELAVVGLSEVIKHYPQIRSVFYNLIEECKKRKPKVILLLDYPDFNLRLADKLKPLGIPIVYYISPQVWAWRKSRIHKIKKLVNKMLVLLPFEVEFYKKHGVDVEFVGHPLLDEINPELDSEIERTRDRSRYGIGENIKLVGLMPGSRRSEINHHLQLEVQVAEKLSETVQGLQFAIFVAPTLQTEELKALLPQTNLPIMLIRDEPFRMIRMADCVLTASGTATLMVGLMGVPMVIIYRMNAISAWIAKMIVKGTAHFGLINLVLGKRIATELFQEQASVEGIAVELSQILKNEDLSKNMRSALLESRKLLGSKGATQNVARVLDGYLYV